MNQRKRNSGKARTKGGSRQGGSRRRNQAPPEGFADFMDLAADEEISEPTASMPSAPPDPVMDTEQSGAEQQSVATPPAPPLRPWHKQQENNTPAWAWGMLPAACTLIVGTGLFSALTFLFKGNPTQLWDFSGLTSLNTLYDLNQHPQHVFFAVLASSVLLLGMVGYRLGSIIGDLKQRVASQGELLSRLTSLRLDNQDAWADPLFKMKPETESFTAEILGAWRHQESRLQRVVGLEGELHRLEKALSEDSREDLASKFDVPVVGMIADEVVQLHDARDAAQEELESWKARLGSKGHELMDHLQDARGWQRFTLDQLNLQGDAVQKAGAHLTAAGSQLAGDPRFGWDPEAVRQLLQDLKADLAGRTGASGGAGAGVTSDLSDRLAKLSFQIGMEVARLGNRGERLGPMAQTLEELTRTIRQQGGDGEAAAAGSTGISGGLLERLEEQLASLDKAAGRPQRNLPQLVRKLGEAARDAAGNLVKIADSFEPQYERLDRIGQVCAELTGVQFDAAGASDHGGPDLQLTQFDPFLKKEPEEDVAVIDPFLERQETVTVQGSALDPFQVSNNVLPGQEDVFASTDADPAETGLPGPEDKVYDLAELGAKRIDRNDERVYDLAEFGAVLISEPLRKAAGDDRVYDLSEFGARRLD